MRNQKSKSNVVCSFVVGALCLIFGITMGILIYIGVLIYENKVTNILEWGTYIILAAFGLFCLGAGVFNLIRYKITKNVSINGKKSIATISDYKAYRGRYKPIHFMCVEYKGESGKSYLNRFSFSFYTVTCFHGHTSVFNS